ncbi:hypothetical protein FPOA_11740 [Fusarium poae]|uniref:Uncharacterized protein n=1 Tax=Fusarium poae TaxID=36050 RepID=A0A1B8AHL5_FUSPO|nr:hypothetical protein FPOA_11740 [Fusarium poae]
MSVFRMRFTQRPIGLATRLYSRQYSTSQALPSRWFTDLQAQLKVLTTNKYPKECSEQAQKLYAFSNDNWLELLAGQQGFLTEKKWRGIDNHQLLWGDMDSMGMYSPPSEPTLSHI